MNTKEQEDDFRIKFGDRFFEIARLADKSDDEGYGKGLVKLLLDIDDFIRETREQAYQKGLDDGYDKGFRDCEKGVTP